MGELTPREMARLSRVAVPPGWVTQTDPQRQRLNNAAASARFLGGFFSLIGCLPLLFAYLDRWAQTWVQYLAFFDTLVLVGPGVWYVIACSLIRRYQQSTVTLTRRVAIAQAILILAMLAATIHWGPSAKFILVPTILSIFFLPAVAALYYELGRAALAINALGPTVSAFSPVVAGPLQAVVLTDNIGRARDGNKLG